MNLCSAPQPQAPFIPITLSHFARSIEQTVREVCLHHGVRFHDDTLRLATNRAGSWPPDVRGWSPYRDQNQGAFGPILPDGNVSFWPLKLYILSVEVSVIEPFNKNKPFVYGLRVNAHITRSKTHIVAPCKSISVQVDLDSPEQKRSRPFVLPPSAKIKPMLADLTSTISVRHAVNMCREPQPSHFGGMYGAYDVSLCDQRNMSSWRVCEGVGSKL